MKKSIASHCSFKKKNYVYVHITKVSRVAKRDKEVGKKAIPKNSNNAELIKTESVETLEIYIHHLKMSIFLSMHELRSVK